MEPLVEVRGVSKKFCRSLRRSMLYGLSDVAGAMVGRQGGSDVLRLMEFWALENLNFTLNEGDALGLVGRNGSGKSTLLRILSGIFPPDKGEVVVRGRIGALIALGAGFHPHMTGRENVFLNGAILGMHSSEIKRKLGEIVDFAELGDFIDSPVATYSSGMLVRLGFSIAAHIEPDILVLDEILAVGDTAFKNKCYAKLAELQGKVRAVILVSHSLDMIRMRCNRGILLDRGTLMFDGDVDGCLRKYEMDSHVHAGAVANNEQYTISMKHASMVYDRSNAEMRVSCSIHASKTLVDLAISISIFNSDGVQVFWCQSDELLLGPMKAGKGDTKLEFCIKELPLVAGQYYFSLGIATIESRETHYLNRAVCSVVVPMPSGCNIRRGVIDARLTIQAN